MIKFRYLRDYGEMSQIAQIEFDKALHGIENPKVILATGNSPQGLYRNLVSSGNSYRHLFVIKLDEWLGIPMDHPSACEHFLKEEFIEPLKIPFNQYLSMDSEAESTYDECKRVASEIDGFPGIEICVLGLGKNGHLGLNEPHDELVPYCHIRNLEISSQNHKMLESSHQNVTRGMTLGLGEIMKAKKILLLVCGENKTTAFQNLKKGVITPQLPASFLWLHPNVEILVDSQSINLN